MRMVMYSEGWKGGEGGEKGKEGGRSEHPDSVRGLLKKKEEFESQLSRSRGVEQVNCERSNQ
jgi:hypothetical protein